MTTRRPFIVLPISVVLMLAAAGLLSVTAPPSDAHNVSGTRVALLKQRPHGQLRLPVRPRKVHNVQRFTGRWPHGHNGVDLSAPRGTLIRSVAWGRVVEVRKWRRSYGKHVIIQHPGGRTVSAHMRGIRVREGQRVHRGQVIGSVGSTGNSTGAHLHLVLKMRGNAVNPGPFLW